MSIRTNEENAGTSLRVESAASPEPHSGGLSGRLNSLRAGVLGANDGIVSVAGIVVGVAAATTNQAAIATAGAAGLVAGAVSMALGEYVSVSTQRDSERALLAVERRELAEQPELELAELAAIYEGKGLTPATAWKVAEELTAQDAFAAHAEAELGIDPTALTDPRMAAGASALAFTLGAMLPLLGILAPVTVRLPVTIVAVLAALAVTGATGARLGRAPVARATMRVLVGGAAAMAATYLIGRVVGLVV
ncbi:VIT1/CCC1 transporter family protein [Nocardia sp. alder85J]|uniref:VIT1/CCC1 transporter family protein n=1 Tax=Nocardia sp. alder85J TaxID=2862949 RepID=UPI001CD81907|nr:VIT family protein [Nocardia sp. alder85J]MCX4095948.1 VIT family protein [Nocardia sp. alder85J]